MPLSKIKVGRRFRRDLGSLVGLAQSIQEVGLLHPIVVDEHNRLIAGRRRLEACKELGWKTVPVHVVSLKDLAQGEIHENMVRKDFTMSEIVAIKRALEPRLKAEKPVGRPRKNSVKFTEFPQSEVKEIIARSVGISRPTLDKAEALVEAAEEDPKTFQPLVESVDSRKTSIEFAFQMLQRKKLHADPPPLPEGEYDVIIADPPWPYEFGLRGAADTHYPSMSPEEIARLRIPAADDAILFLWATAPKFKAILNVMEAWGFDYRTHLVWAKDKIGTGYYARAKFEDLLIGVKGHMAIPAEDARPPALFEAPRGKHSEKPDKAYELIEQMYPNRRYLELFARKTRWGWTSWGDNISSTAI